MKVQNNNMSNEQSKKKKYKQNKHGFQYVEIFIESYLSW